MEKIWEFYENLDEYVYVADIDSYELVYMNRKAREAFNVQSAKCSGYICPECHEVFRPRFKEVFWAYHTPKMRRLTCPKCGHKGLCVEVYAEKEDKNNG